MGVAGGPDLIQDGLVLSLDASDRNSYVSGSTTWFDLSGVNDFTLYNGVGFTSSFNGSLVLDGVNDYCYRNYPSNFPTSSQLVTISVWFNQSAASANTQGMEVFGIGNNAGGSGARLGVWLNAPNQIPFITGSIGIEALNCGKFYSGSIANPGTWVNFTATLTGSKVDDIVLYLNGQLLSNTLSQSGSITVNLNTGTSYLAVGTIPGATSAHMYRGSIGSIQVYNRALSASEIQQNYNAQKSKFGL
jgi:hypothetical protein